MVLVSAEGKKITKSLPLQASVGNMVRRILKIIREEYVSTQQVWSAMMTTFNFNFMHMAVAENLKILVF
jgi:translation initiation factor 2B subunit (eIF-2B alpha/beta/delta family)